MNGFLSLIKPVGVSSFEVVRRVKRITGEKAGHLGTLDPIATGVLPVAVGKATKLIPYINASRKIYQAEITFGIQTDTLDSSGKIVEEKKFKHITKENLIDIFKKFTGKILQVPPKFSALKYKGRRFYELARKNIEVGDPPERTVNIERIELLSFKLPKVSIKVTCSGGTYIRSLARDIGLALNSVAHLSGLVRLEDGTFKISSSISLEEAEKNFRKHIKSPEEILNFSSLKFDKKDIVRIKNGEFLEINEEMLKGMKEEYFFANSFENELVALCKAVRDEGKIAIKPCRVF